MKRFLLVLLMVLPLKAYGQMEHLETPIFDGMMQQIPDPDDPTKMLEWKPPVEPDFKPVKYMKQEPATSLRERVDRLLYGIKIDIPPEFDHYGYEIRRYMAHIAGPDVINNPKRIEAELKNIRKAKIVHEYWRKEVMKEIGEIGKEIEAQNPSSDVRTSYKYNSGVSLAFLAECGNWIAHNEKLLEFLLKKQGAYVFKMPVYTFHDERDRLTFANYFSAAYKSRKFVNEYVPFAVMVY